MEYSKSCIIDIVSITIIFQLCSIITEENWSPPMTSIVVFEAHLCYRLQISFLCYVMNKIMTSWEQKFTLACMVVTLVNEKLLA